MELFLLALIGLTAAWFVFKAVTKEAKEGKCAGCPGCADKTKCKKIK